MPIRPFKAALNPLQLKAFNLEIIPNFIILPSMLQPFVKMIDGIIFINPG